MKRVCVSGLLLLLAGCNVTRQAEVSRVDVPQGLVWMTFGEAMLQDAHYDSYVTNGTATRECQAMGYNTAMAYGQPVKTCSLIGGSLCLNKKVTIQYQCQGYAPQPAVTTSAYY